MFECLKFSKLVCLQRHNSINFTLIAHILHSSHMFEQTHYFKKYMQINVKEQI